MSPAAVRARVAALLQRAATRRAGDARARRTSAALVHSDISRAAGREAGARSASTCARCGSSTRRSSSRSARAAAEAVAELYRARGLSTDTAVEAGYVVYIGLGDRCRSLEPGRRIRRVLIVGPGLDLAPRTGLLEAGPPESYQPWAVIDALVSLGLSAPTISSSSAPTSTRASSIICGRLARRAAG